jgi:hypothetical protein
LKAEEGGSDDKEKITDAGRPVVAVERRCTAPSDRHVDLNAIAGPAGRSIW